MKNKKMFIIGTVAILSVIMNFVDMVISPAYYIKSAVKLILFISVPAAYFACNKEDFLLLKQLFEFDLKATAKYILLGIFFYIAMVAGFMFTNGIFDFSNITGQLTANIGVTKNNFIYVSVYISFINSLLEEFFFRGFGFMVLKKYIPAAKAGIISAFLFAFYHIGMTVGWVDIMLYCLGFAGLVAGGIIFNRIDEKENSIYPSWIVHMFINFGINTVGFMLFGII